MRRACIIGLLILYSLFGHSQTEIGLAGGGSVWWFIGNMSGNPSVEQLPYFQYSVRGHVIRTVSNNWEIATGLEYDRKGNLYRLNLTDAFGNSNGNTVNIETNIPSIQMPITVGYKFGGQVSLTPALGLYAGWMISATERNTPSQSSFGSFETNARGKYNDVDIGAIAQIRVVYMLNDKNRAFLAMRYTSSVLSFSSSSRLNVFQNSSSICLGGSRVIKSK